MTYKEVKKLIRKLEDIALFSGSFPVANIKNESDDVLYSLRYCGRFRSVNIFQ